MRKVLPFLKKFIFYSILIIVCFEVALWILGFRPYENVDYKVEAEPKNAFIGDSLFGIQLNPGSYDIILNDSVNFKATHLGNGQRQVTDIIYDTIFPGPAIHFFGCSFTYGYGVNDLETFAALTQKSLPQRYVNNHAVSGYGTIHSALQLQKMESLNENDVVLLCFSSYHFMRNSLSQEYRSRLKIGFENSSQNLNKRMDQARFPSKQSCSDEVTYIKWNDMYDNWTGRETFASINFFQTQWDRFSDSGIDQIALAQCLIEEMAEKCKADHVKFAVVCLDQDRRTIKLHENLNHIPWLDIQFDFGNPVLTNLPHDSHPNALGHQYIHSKLSPFVKEILSK